MADISVTPDLSALDIPKDVWTQPFWDAAAAGELRLPRCADCKTYRWPPGPFCPQCQSQQVDWQPAGAGRVYSFTIIPPRGETATTAPTVPALIEFPDAGGIRLVAAIVATDVSILEIGAAVKLGWSQAANGMMPVFSL